MKKRFVWVAASKDPKIRSHLSRPRFRTEAGGVNLASFLGSPTDFSVMVHEQKFGSGSQKKSPSNPLSKQPRSKILMIIKHTQRGTQSVEILDRVLDKGYRWSRRRGVERYLPEIYGAAGR
jgi:hypothetical protein